MSKKSRKRNKLLLAGAALFGASKLGILGGKTAASNVVGKTDAFKKSVTEFSKKPSSKGPTLGAKDIVKKKIPGKKGKDVISSGPFKMFGITSTEPKFSKESVAAFKKSNEAQKNRRSKSIFGINIDSLKSKIANAAESRAAKKDAFNLKVKANNAKIKNPGSYFNKGTMVKARGGGMARNKPTKLY